MQRTLITFFVILAAILLFFFRIRKSDAFMRDAYQRFMDDEREANFSRKNDPAPWEFMHFDVNSLPIREYPEEFRYNRVAGRQRDALELAQSPMLRVGNMTNRELKLKYGAANLDMIISYDENYNQFIHGLLEWGAALISISSLDDAEIILEAAIDCGCDRSQAYTMLADIFTERRENERLNELYVRARDCDILTELAKNKTLDYISNKRGSMT